MTIDLNQTWNLNGILLGIAADVRSEGQFTPFQISTADAVHPCVIPNSNLVRHLMAQPLCHHEFLVCATQGGYTADALLVLEAHPKVSFNPLVELWRGLCPVEGTVPGILDLIADIQIWPLRLMLQQVFSRRDVAKSFWVMPASLRHHHAYPGGLAHHTFEVARDMAGQSCLGMEERDLGIAGGLVHDIGKVWAYQTDMSPNAASMAMGHALIGLSKLEDQIRSLEAEWPEGAYTLRSLMVNNPRVRDDGCHPTSLLQRLRAADQRSTEQDRVRTGSPRVWVPGPWRPSQPAESPMPF